MYDNENMAETPEVIGDRLSLREMSLFLDKSVERSHIHIFDSLVSTNVTAKNRAQADPEASGHIYIADKQTEGRGTKGRAFFSPPGGIYISFIIKPEKIFASRAHVFTIAAAVAVCEAIEEVTGASPGIKWVNDILLDDKKIGGILTEASLNAKDGSFNSIVIGTGLNFSAKMQDFPEEIRHKAGALYMDKKPEVSRNRLIAELINNISSITDEGSLKNFDRIKEKYRLRLDTLGKRIEVHCGSRIYEAYALDIDDNAGLIIKKDDGAVEVLSSGEVSVVKSLQPA